MRVRRTARRAADARPRVRHPEDAVVRLSGWQAPMRVSLRPPAYDTCFVRRGSLPRFTISLSCFPTPQLRKRIA